MGRHELRPQRQATMTRVVGLAGMAAAAATLAITVSTGTAEAKPNLFGKPNATDDGSSTAKVNTATPTATTSNHGSTLSSIAPNIYNPGPFTIGKVTSTQPGLIVKPPVPGSKPFAQVTGIQLPFWTVNNGTPVPPA